MICASGPSPRFRRVGPAAMVRSVSLITGLTLCAITATAQSQTERGEAAWRSGTAYALQGNADSALRSFQLARQLGQTVGDTALLAAALRGAAEVQWIYMGCRDSALVLLQRANTISMEGDRAAGLLLIRRLANSGKIAEARSLHAALYADLADEVPRSITRESVQFLTAQAIIQRAAGQDVAALASLRQARGIANRLATGDDVAGAEAMPVTEINSRNYWIAYEMADLMLTSKTRGVMSAADGKTLMDAVARNTDEPEEGNERRFSAFRLADRLALKAWRCTMNGEKCPIPPPRTCRP